MTPIERMRQVCRRLPEVTEAPHFGETMFKSRGRPFASFGEKDGVTRVVVQLAPAHVEAVLAADPRASRYPRARDCVALEITDATDWDEVLRLVLESHRLTAKEKKAAKKSPQTRKTANKKAAKKETR